MFSVSFLVDDKNLATVLASLGNKVMNLDIAHVTNATVKAGKAVQKYDGATIKDALFQSMLDVDPDLQKGKIFGKAFITQIVKELGGSESSAPSYIPFMLKNKLIRRVDRGQYAVLKGNK